MNEAQKCLYHIVENMRMDKTISKEGYEYFQQAIKALEQEPILDKIRAEIDAESAKSFKYPNWERAKALEWVLGVIDKYRKEE